MSNEFLREHPQILLNKTIKKTYQTVKVLGRGTFSVVYQCLNVENQDKLAIKVAFAGQGDKMLNLQKKIYRILSSAYGNGEAGFAKYYQYGKTQRFSFIVLERLSVSVQDIFTKLDHKFSLKTVLNFGLQAIELIQKLHKIKYIHRDIKPGNFILGHGSKKDKIYLVDFGLARKVSEGTQNDSQRRRIDDQIQMKNKKFIGTKRFASIASHMGVEQGKKDDLQSLGYILIFLLKGRLPWQGIKLSNKPQQHETIGKIKQEIQLEQFCSLDIKDQIYYSGDVFLKLFRYLRVLKCKDEPNYDFLKKMFIEEINQVEKRPNISGFNRWKCKGKFDWMDETEEDSRDSRDSRQGRQSRQSRQSRDSRDIRDSRQSRGNRDRQRRKSQEHNAGYTHSKSGNHRQRYMR